MSRVRPGPVTKARHKKILKDNEIKQFTSIGDKFNPELHEALMTKSGDDDNIIVVNKKPGMVVHPSFGHYSGTLVHALLFKYTELNKLDRRSTSFGS